MSRPRWYAPLTALAGGLAAGLAHPPFGLLPGLLGFSLILLRLETAQGPRPLRQAFLLGWLAGLGYFGISTWWIGEPFLVDAAVYGWMAPFAIVLMGGGLALFWAPPPPPIEPFGPEAPGRCWSSPACSPPPSGCAGTS